MKDEKWYWPIRLLKSLARLPINCDSWLGHGDVYKRQLKSVCYAFGHLYGKREGISPEALMKECVHDAEQASYHPRKELNQAIAQHLMQGDLQENLNRM